MRGWREMNGAWRAVGRLFQCLLHSFGGFWNGRSNVRCRTRSVLWVIGNFCVAQLLFAQPAPAEPELAYPVQLDSVTVYLVRGVDSTTVQAEAQRVEKILSELRSNIPPAERIQLREQEGGAGVILLDTVAVLTVYPENRVDTTRSPLANALAIRRQILTEARTRPTLATWEEEELLLRLLLGVVYPFSLLVILRLARYGLRTWEKSWRSAVRHWLENMAQRRGLSDEEMQSRRILNFLTGLERIAIYGAAMILISFIWFALFPQTQPLANTLLLGIIHPILELIGLTARSILLLLYTAAVIGIAYLLNRHLVQRRRLQVAPAILYDPIVYFPLRVLIWLVALFFVLFPYPGAPRLFAVGILLLALLASLMALRPIIEEIAAGIYLNSAHALKTGAEILLDGVHYRIFASGLVHICLLRDDEQHWLPYSKILKSDLAILSRGRARHD